MGNFTRKELDSNNNWILKEPGRQHVIFATFDRGTPGGFG
jgi:hypothetical protein